MQHGKISTYTNYKCKCDECRRAWKMYQARYKLTRARAGQRLVPAVEACEHLRYLMTHGWTSTTIAAECGSTKDTILAIARGERQKIGKQLSKKILGMNTIRTPRNGRRAGGFRPVWETPPLAGIRRSPVRSERCPPSAGVHPLGEGGQRLGTKADVASGGIS